MDFSWARSDVDEVATHYSASHSEAPRPIRSATATGINNVEQIGRLVLLHEEDLIPTWDPSHYYAIGCTLKTRELVNGQMQVTKWHSSP